jgi:hypothetical protein
VLLFNVGGRWVPSLGPGKKCPLTFNNGETGTEKCVLGAQWWGMRAVVVGGEI